MIILKHHLHVETRCCFFKKQFFGLRYIFIIVFSQKSDFYKKTFTFVNGEKLVPHFALCLVLSAGLDSNIEVLKS